MDEELAPRPALSPGKRTLTGGPIQMRRAAASPAAAPARDIAPGSGGGRALPGAAQSEWGRAFGTDLSDVRIHADSPQPAQLGAVAFAQGDDIHFAPSTYDPSSANGRELLGHELTHVVQQRAGRVEAPQGKGAPINADPGLEAEADELGARAAAGELVGGLVSAAPRGLVQRQSEAEVNQAIAVKRGVQGEARDELNDARRAAAAVQDQLQICHNRLSAIRSRLNSAREQVAPLKAELTEARVKLERARTANTELDQQLTKEDVGHQAEEVAAREREASEHREIHARAQEAIAACDQDISDLEAEIEKKTALEASAATDQPALPASASGEIEVDREKLANARDLRARLADAEEAARAGATQAADRVVSAAERLEKIQASVAAVETAQTGVALAERRVVRNDGEVHSEGLVLGREHRAIEGHEASAAARSDEQEVAQTAYEDASRDLATYTIGAARLRIGELVDMGLPQGDATAQLANAQTLLAMAPDRAADIAVAAWEALPREAVTGPTKEAMDTYKSELVARLEGKVYDKLRARRWHQFGKKRELRQKLKTAARRVIGVEIQALVGGEEGAESALAYRETRAKRDAYSAVKPEVDAFLQQVSKRIAERAVDEQKERLAAAAMQRIDPMAALRAGDAQSYQAAKLRGLALADELLEQAPEEPAEQQAPPVDGVAPPRAQDLEAEVEQFVTDRGVAQQVLEASSSEEASGVLGKLLDTIVPDPGDGVMLNITLNIPVAADPSGVTTLFLSVEVNGKAGRGTEGFVTAGVPNIAKNPAHLELEANYAIGLKATAGFSGAGVDLSAKYESFVRAGADSTLSAMAAFRYGIYRGTPIKSLAAAWYGGLTKGKGPQGADYLLAEQRAAAVEDEHFLGEDKGGTFAHHGRGFGVGAAAGVLGAKGKVAGGGRHFRNYNQGSLRADRDALGEGQEVPRTREAALERRKNMHGASGNSFAFSGETEVGFGGEKFTISAAISGSGIKNWGVEIKAALSGSLANGAPMDLIVMLAASAYELEQRMLNAIGKHLDQEAEMRQEGMSKSEIQQQLAAKLGKRGAATTAIQGGAMALSATGLVGSSIALSFQFGKTNGTWVCRVDFISSTKLATPDALPVYGSLEKETRLITAEKNEGGGAFMSPGVHVPSGSDD